MPDIFYHVCSAITGARVVIDLTDRDLAISECDRLNREAETGVRAAYGEGADHVPAQRLVASNSGVAEHTAGLLPASHVGRILHDGQLMSYQLAIESRLSSDELARERAQQLAASDPHR